MSRPRARPLPPPVVTDLRDGDVVDFALRGRWETRTGDVRVSAGVPFVFHEQGNRWLVASGVTLLRVTRDDVVIAQVLGDARTRAYEAALAKLTG